MNGSKSKFSAIFRAHWPLVAVAVFWISVGVANVAGLVPEPSFGFGFSASRDFCDFRSCYLGGVAAADGRWDELYPPELSGLPGTVRVSYPPALDMRDRGLSERVPPWLYPPPAAVLFLPLSVFRYPTAVRLAVAANFVLLLLLLHVVRSEMAERRCRSFLSDTLLVSIGCGYSAWLQFRALNLGFLLSLSLVLALRGLRKRRVAGPAAGTVLLGVTKGLSAVWAPLFLFERRWKTVAGCCLLGLALVGAAAAAGCGIGPYRVFLSVYLPAAGSFVPDFNDGLPFFLSRSVFPAVSHRLLASACHAVFFLLLAVVYACSFASCRRSRTVEETPGPVFSELSYVLAFLLYAAFNTVCWKHYRIHLLAFFPLFWGHVCRTGLLRAFMVALLAAEFLPVRLLLGFAVDRSPLPRIPGIGACFYALLIALGFTAFFRLLFRRRSPVFRHAQDPSEPSSRR